MLDKYYYYYICDESVSESVLLSNAISVSLLLLLLVSLGITFCAYLLFEWFLESQLPVGIFGF